MGAYSTFLLGRNMYSVARETMVIFNGLIYKATLYIMFGGIQNARNDRYANE